MDLPIIPGTLEAGVCFQDEQTRLVAFSAAQHAVLPGLAFYNFGSTKPSVENQAYPWFRTTDGRWYFFSGVWRAPIPSYSVFERRLWYGNATTDLEVYDGGSAGAVTTESGPTWEVDTDFDGRSPMGPGAIPASDPAKTLSLAEAYGDGSHVQTTLELAPHTHLMEFATTDVGGGLPSAASGTPVAHTFTTLSTGGGEAMNMVHPVRGIYILKRTARTFYTVP